ncbi:unnamed protein product [Ectocarpus fasciculatus]
MCRACRSASILHVRVNHQTPSSLWTSRTTQTRPNTRSSKLRISSRVPVVRALRLTWSLSMEDLLRKAAIELWTWSQRLELQGSSCAAGLGPEVLVWPRGLTELVLQPDSDLATGNVWWPVHVQCLALRGSFNQPIAEIAFNQPFAGVVWPTSLRSVTRCGQSLL